MITLEGRRSQAADEDAWAAAGLSKGGLTRFVREAQRAVGLAGAVDVLLADDRTLRRLNREFRGKDEATDVLSFPAAGEFAAELAGHLAISLKTAARQAREHGHGLGDEVRVLLLHGLLHLNGMDHETDRGEMAAREGELRVRLRLPNGLIARVEGASSGAKESRSPYHPSQQAGRGPRSGMTTERKATAKAKAGLRSVASYQLPVVSKGRAKTKTSAKRVKR
jgi:probable rRNA maturation factor